METPKIDEYGNFIDKDKDRVVASLHTGNKHLDGLTKAYFASYIQEPKLGKDYFKWVEHHFDYALREYSITHSYKISPSQNPTRKELLKLNDIPCKLFLEFTKKVDDILQSYTDKEWTIEKKHQVLKKHIRSLAEADSNEESKFDIKLNKIDGLDDRTTRFLNDILREIQESGLNQIKNSRYMVIDKLFDIYKDKENFLDAYGFKEKKKYLKKLSMEQAKIRLHGYIKNMMEDGYIEISQEEMQEDYENPTQEMKNYIEDVNIYNKSLLQKVRWFLFYLVYDANKIDIFMIHSILGYKYDGAVKVYQKLFFKDHHTGKNENFLHHIDILNLSEDSIYDRSHEAEYDRQITEMIEYKGLKANQVKKDKTCQYILNEKMFTYDGLYEQILNSFMKTPQKEETENLDELSW